MAQRGRSRVSPPARASLPPVDASKVRSVIEAAVVDAGYELEDLAVKPVGRRHLVRAIIDGDGGLGLDAIAKVSRAVSQALDDAETKGRELLPGEYQLEVSSPGVDRPLTTPAHWRRNVGRTVKVKVGDKTLTGRVSTANEQSVTLDVGGAEHALRFDKLGPGRVQIEFSRLEDIADEELEEFSDVGDDDEDEEER
jgi:ribosome maturation factor RimP